jgi:putative ATPase
MSEAERTRHYGRRTILFVDEIHRFNKAQQDAFLPYVENGSITLIGATTENPSFELNSALLSRSKVFVLHALSVEDIVGLLNRSLADTVNGLGAEVIRIDPSLIEQMAVFANGDARTAYNTLEIAAQLAPPDEAGVKTVTPGILEDAFQKRMLLYDKAGEEHYNLISALHKSMRNSDPDATLYWLGRMLESGEDPLYIARRIVRFASEDVGMADPMALPLAVSAMQAFDFIGLPEGNLALAQAAVYMATAPKSNALYRAYGAVAQDVKNTLAEPVPLHLRNAPTKLMKELDYGKGYQYAHDFQDKLTDMSCLPKSLEQRVYFTPSDEGFEQTVQARLKSWREKIQQLKNKK